MNPSTIVLRADFDELLAQHTELIRLANELEFQLYQLGEQSVPGPVSDCQQAAGKLIGVLRHFLFRHDQQVLPVLESLASEAARVDPPHAVDSAAS